MSKVRLRVETSIQYTYFLEVDVPENITEDNLELILDNAQEHTNKFNGGYAAITDYLKGQKIETTNIEKSKMIHNYVDIAEMEVVE